MKISKANKILLTTILITGVIPIMMLCGEAEAVGLKYDIYGYNDDGTPTPGEAQGNIDLSLIGGSKLTAGVQYDYVIITNNPMRGVFQRFADYKNALGFKTIVVTVEDIGLLGYNINADLGHASGAWDSTDYAGNREKGLRVRSFIKDAFMTWRAKYILLGGDADVIPIFYAFGKSLPYSIVRPGGTVSVPLEDNIWTPCDLYYGGLDGKWYYHQHEGSTSYDQDIDIIAEVYVGRAPVSTADEANAFVDKTIGYRVDKERTWNVLMVGDRMIESPEIFATETLDAIANDMLAANSNCHIEKMCEHRYNGVFETYTGQQLLNGFTSGDVNPNYVTANGLNSNHHDLIIHLGHSNPISVMRLATADFISSHPGASAALFSDINNTAQQAIIYSMGCFSGSFDGIDTAGPNSALDGDCVGEKLVAQAGTGAVAFIGTARVGKGKLDINGYCEHYADHFAKKIHTTLTLGESLQLARQEVFGEHLSCFEPHTTWMYSGLQLNLLGDPTIVLYLIDRTAPAECSVSINGGTPYTNNTAVTLALSATDAESGIGAGSQMKFSNDNVTWSDVVEAYVTTKSWELSSGDGTKTVYVKFKDAAGNWTTAEIIDTIILCTTPPVASFTANPATGISPLTVGFTSNSTGVITSQSWSFGDGGTSTQPSPSHVYTTPGKYTVSLTVTGPGGSNTKTMTDCITATSCTGTGTIVANVAFTSYPDIKIPGIEVKLWKKEAGDIEYSLYATMITNGTGVCLFSNLPLKFPTSSTSSTSYKVKAVPQFGYAAYESGDITFSHPAWPGPGYSGLMICDVRLTRVTLNKGVISGCVTSAETATPLANINVQLWKRSYTDLDFVLLQSVATNTAGGYSFIDLPEIFYHNAPQAILYKVKVAAEAGYEAYEGEQLKFYNGMSNWVDAIQQDAALTAIPPVASFTASPVSGTAPLMVQFTDESTGEITDYAWDFGDGNSSTEQNPSHAYTGAGTYTATLTVSNPGGSDSASVGITVNRNSQEIRDAINTASPGSTIILPEGTYTFTSQLKITKNITIKGTNPDNTILQLGNYNILIKDGLYLNQNEAYYRLYDNLTDVTFENLTIRDYTGTNPNGPIEAYVRNFLTLKNCRLIHNKGTRVSGIYYGGTYKTGTDGKLYKTGGVKLINTLIAQNWTEEGHGYDGPYFPNGTDANGKIIYWSSRSVIRANGGKLEVYNSTIADNIDDSDPSKKVKYAAIFLDTANLNTMVNTIMRSNGSNIDDIYVYRAGLITNITYSDIEAALDGCGTMDGAARVAGEGSIYLDPQFICPRDDDYSIREDISPCKGTGLNGADMGARF